MLIGGASYKINSINIVLEIQSVIKVVMEVDHAIVS